ncbi:NUDIX hydrolase [Litchfieldia salsa]|uniref:Isopentenyldiphosphate isomerase n=1 Tax=Litchfieldia salsa TaxID=930152 RepID=A0A1H0SZ75_9BACI|nr:NUDIX domain-containing protein [Litchfieldia salsa]SDP46528.1 Isopentenyldiphosphate isomerase [Litchfieldia salsa]
MSEELKIFDKKRNEIGVAQRDQVHIHGYWHETFHCWFVDKKDGVNHIYFQKRSDVKKDYPNLLDITAAGHILSNESVSDGIREVREELGINVEMEELIPLGIIEDCIISNSFIDREFGHVYVYHMKDKDTFILQQEEVSGIAKTRFDDFFDLCLGEKDTIKIEGFEINEFGKTFNYIKSVSLNEFVPHQRTYLENVAKLIADNLRS